MKIHHKVPMNLRTTPPEANTVRYQAEVDQAVQRAERAWRRAERRRLRAEDRVGREPTAINRDAYQLILAAAERLWAEFENLDRLMRQAPVSAANSGSGQVRHRTGCDDNLQLGVQKSPRAKRRPRERGRKVV